jgi:ligand-binding sensor domain-containing protein
MSLMLPFVNAICFYVDYDKYLIGGVEGGIFEWNGKSDKAIPILGNNVKSVVNYIYTDNQNNIWACTDEGIVLFQKHSFRNLD